MSRAAISDEKPTMMIIGATGGIGSVLCRQLGDSGMRLVLGARRREPLETLRSELLDRGSEDVVIGEVEARSSASVEGFVAMAKERCGRLDGVAHLVGSILLKPAHLTTEAEWSETLDVNLTSAFHVLRHVAKAMFGGGGSIVFVSTAAARKGLRNHEAIAAAKAGLHGLTLSAAASYAPRNIRVNCLAPGLVDTPLAARITRNEKALEASRTMHALGRIGRPEDVASAASWLLDPFNSWVTGQIIGIDGGLADLQVR